MTIFRPSPLTTKGDVMQFNGGDKRLAIGTTGQVLTVEAGLAAWAAAGGGGGSAHWELVEYKALSGDANYSFASLTEAKKWKIDYQVFTAQASTNVNIRINNLSTSVYNYTHKTEAGVTGQDASQAQWKVGDVSNGQASGTFEIDGRVDQNDMLCGFHGSANAPGGGTVSAMSGSVDLGASAIAVSRIDLLLGAGTMSGFVAIYKLVIA